MAGLGEGIGSLIGNLFGASNVGSAIQGGVNNVNADTWAGAAQVMPYNAVGASYLGPVAEDLLGTGTASQNIGSQRMSAAGRSSAFSIRAGRGGGACPIRAIDPR